MAAFKKHENNSDVTAEPRNSSNLLFSTRVTTAETKLFTARLSPVLYLLQVASFFPGPMRRNAKCFYLKSMILLLICLGAIGINVYLCVFTVEQTIKSQKIFGLLHAGTVTCIITGTKPVINVLAFCIFLAHLKHHRILLTKLDQIDSNFGESFGKFPNLATMNRSIFCALIFVFLIPCVARICEFIGLGDRLGRNLLSDTSIVLIPLLSVWNLAPLFYYHYLNVVVRFWCRTLREKLSEEAQTRNQTLQFYYSHYLEVAGVQKYLGKVFNPFIFMSYGWSLFTLCLAIYFVTQAGDSMSAPPVPLKTEAQKDLWNKVVLFNMTWCALQIFVALLTIATICATGTSTNEQISSFVYKNSGQLAWGMSVCRIFLIERSVFLTIGSIIVTYALMLMKLKDTGSKSLISATVHNATG